MEESWGRYAQALEIKPDDYVAKSNGVLRFAESRAISTRPPEEAQILLEHAKTIFSMRRLYNLEALPTIWPASPRCATAPPTPSIGYAPAKPTALCRPKSTSALTQPRPDPRHARSSPPGGRRCLAGAMRLWVDRGGRAGACRHCSAQRAAGWGWRRNSLADNRSRGCPENPAGRRFLRLRPPLSGPGFGQGEDGGADGGVVAVGFDVFDKERSIFSTSTGSSFR